MAIETDQPYVEIVLRGDEDELPTLLDVTSFLYDFNLLYEFSRQFSWNRKGRPLSDSDRLRVVRLRQGSPVHLVAAVLALPATAGAIFTMLQVIEKIRNWNLNREILLLQRDKLRQDVLQSGAKPAPISEEYVFQVNTRTEEAEYFLDRTARRLELGAVRVKELEIKVTTRLPTEE